MSLEDQPMPWCERCQCYHHDTAPHIHQEPPKYTMTIFAPAQPSLFQTGNWSAADAAKFCGAAFDRPITDAIDKVVITYETGLTVTFERVK